VPIALALLILGFLRLPESSDPGTGRLDLTGTVILSLAILSLMYGLTNIDVDFRASFREWDVSGFIGAGIILFIVLLAYESLLVRRKNGDPILPMTLIRQPRYLMVLLIGMLSGGMLVGMIFIPGFTENVLGIEAEKSGYWMTPLALASGVGAGMGGMLVSKRGPIFTVVLSGIVTAVGFALFPLWTALKWQFIISSMVAGVGIGIILGAPLNILATEGLRANKGTALASLSLLRQIGMTLMPTIYAGFIARGYNNMGELFRTDFRAILNENVEKANLSQEALDELAAIGRQMASGGGESANVGEIVGQIQDPALRDVVERSVAEVTRMAAENGYGGLYWAAAVLGVLVIAAALILAPMRRKVAAPSAEG